MEDRESPILMKHRNDPKAWSLVWWLFTLIGLPVTFPWFLYQLVQFVRLKRRRSILKHKVVLITGASSGLGEALAHAFYASGCRVVLAARRTEELQRVKSDLMEKHRTDVTHPPVVLSLDLADVNSLPAKICKVIDIHGQIDILVNNAGISYRGEAVGPDVNVDMKVMLINYFAQIAISKAVLPYMIKRGCGHIVYISSLQGKIAIPHRSAYGASKHALQAWCDSARAELASQNIKITVVSPGYIKTDLSLNALTGDGQKYGVMDKTIAQGYPADYVAQRVLRSVLLEEKEIIIAPFLHRSAVFLRYFLPSTYFKVMEERAKLKSE